MAKGRNPTVRMTLLSHSTSGYQCRRGHVDVTRYSSTVGGLTGPVSLDEDMLAIVYDEVAAGVGVEGAQEADET